MKSWKTSFSAGLLVLVVMGSITVYAQSTPSREAGGGFQQSTSSGPETQLIEENPPLGIQWAKGVFPSSSNKTKSAALRYHGGDIMVTITIESDSLLIVRGRSSTRVRYAAPTRR